MKRLALLLLLLPALAGAKTPDENDILDRTLDSSSPFYYPNLMMRYNAGDSTLTPRTTTTSTMVTRTRRLTSRSRSIPISTGSIRPSRSWTRNCRSVNTSKGSCRRERTPCAAIRSTPGCST